MNELNSKERNLEFNVPYLNVLLNFPSAPPLRYDSEKIVKTNIADDEWFRSGVKRSRSSLGAGRERRGSEPNNTVSL